MAKGNRSGTGGGGIASRVNVRPPMRTGQPASGINPGHVGQHGTALGNKAMNDAKRLSPAVPKFTAGPTGGAVPLGNATAFTAGQGAGAGRQIMKAGGQGTHGPVDPGNPPPAGELFPGWPAMTRK